MGKKEEDDDTRFQQLRSHPDFAKAYKKNQGMTIKNQIKKYVYPFLFLI